MKRIIILFIILIAGVAEGYSQIAPCDQLIPNVFTPNNDGVNDTFHVNCLTESWNLFIYDRWGNLVYASKQGQGAAWDGYNMVGLKVDDGVYFYIFSQQNSESSLKGTVHLMR